MKSIIKIAVCLLLLVSMNSAWAKGRRTRRYVPANAPSGWNFTISSVGAGQSYYTPDLGFWNNVSEIRNWDVKFDAMHLWNGNVEFGIYDRIQLRAEGSYATATAKQTVIPPQLGGGSQSKTISLMPVNALLLYEFTDGNVKPYLGGGAGTVFVNSTSERIQSSGVVSGKSNSMDYMYYAVGGVKLPIADNFFVGVEARGAFGKYQEMVKDTHQVSTLQNISLNGFQVGVSANYRF